MSKISRKVIFLDSEGNEHHEFIAAVEASKTQKAADSIWSILGLNALDLDSDDVDMLSGTVRRNWKELLTRLVSVEQEHYEETEIVEN